MNKSKEGSVNETANDSGKKADEKVLEQIGAEDGGKPVENGKPIDNEKVSESEKAAMNEKPKINGKPIENGKPELSGKPAEIEKPIDTEKSETNAKPAEIAKPIETEKPEITGKPAENAEPIETEKPETNAKPAGNGKPTRSKKSAQAENAKNNGPEQTKKKKKHHVWLYIMGLLAAVLLLIYFGAAFIFKSHFLPNTYINGMDVAYLDAESAEKLLESIGAGYQLQVVDRDDAQVGVISAADVGLTVNARAGVDALLQSQEIYQWPRAFTQSRGEEVGYAVDFDQEKLRELVKSWDAMQVKNVQKPEDAYISEYLSEKKGYEIIAETMGTELDLESVLAAAGTAIAGLEKTMKLDTAECYVPAKITSDDVKLNKKLDTLNKWAGACITYDWNGTEVVLDGDTIHEWIIEDGDTLSLDEEQITGFVKAQAKENDTYGKKRKFTTALGVELTLPGGAYGWRTDREAEAEELLKLIQAGSVIKREPAYAMQGAHKGKNDIGSSYVEIDLSNQHLYLFIEGQIVLETDFVSGDMTIKGRMTPPGVFGLTYKTTNAVLRGEDYETPVSYWMPFNGNVGMHDATWRRSFGGDIYLTNGSHGCINLPYSKAREIYGYMSNGFPVICYYY